MKYRWLVVMALAAAGAVWIAQALLGSDEARSHFFFVEVFVAKATAMTGALVAASSFKRGDYLRRAWLLIAGDYVFLLAKDLLFGSHVFVNGHEVLFGQSLHLPGIDPSSALAGELRAAFVLVGNALAVAGAFLLARAWRIAGMELPGSQARQRSIVIAVVVVSIAVAGYGARADMIDFVHTHHTGAIVAFLSDIGDLLSFCFTAPVLMTAWALRGGKLMWPWALFTLAQVAWMLFDAVATFGDLLHLSPAGVRGATETVRALACMLCLGAGLAQRWAVAKRS